MGSVPAVLDDTDGRPARDVVFRSDRAPARHQSDTGGNGDRGDVWISPDENRLARVSSITEIQV